MIITVIISVILVIVVIAVIFIGVVTRAVDDKSEKAAAIGGMLTSDTIKYQSDGARGLEKKPLIKIMQMVWKFCDNGDKKKHLKQTPPENIEGIYDIPYIDDGNRYHMLDIYYPESTTGKLPAIIDIHGGGWMYGEKSLNEYYCKSLSSRGFIVFNISYRLVPDVTVNEQLCDIMEALRWIGSNMKNYPCDAESIMLTGDSAGGQLAVYSAVLLQSSELREVFGTISADIDLDALLLTSPVSYMKGGVISAYTKIMWGKDYRNKSLYEYMNLDEIIDYAKLPPTYLITSSGDLLAHTQTCRAAELLKSKGVNCTLRDYGKYNGKKLAHVFSVLEPFDEIGAQTIDDAVQFYRDLIEHKSKVFNE